MEVKEVCSFFLEGKCRFQDRCRNLHPQDLEIEKSEHLIEETQESSDTDKKKSKTMDEVDRRDRRKSGDKKPPMKTASDVISRIQWDTSLPAEHFVIGYLDRFLGILEQPFSVFDWNHLAEVDHTVLAIPKHRIQYFKYKDEKVWDKTTRLDFVFGSTGASTSIEELMNKIDTRLMGDTPRVEEVEEA